MKTTAITDLLHAGGVETTEGYDYPTSVPERPAAQVRVSSVHDIAFGDLNRLHANPWADRVDDDPQWDTYSKAEPYDYPSLSFVSVDYTDMTVAENIVDLLTSAGWVVRWDGDPLLAIHARK